MSKKNVILQIIRTIKNNFICLNTDALIRKWSAPCITALNIVIRYGWHNLQYDAYEKQWTFTRIGFHGSPVARGYWILKSGRPVGDWIAIKFE